MSFVDVKGSQFNIGVKLISSSMVAQLTKWDTSLVRLNVEDDSDIAKLKSVLTQLVKAGIKVVIDPHFRPKGEDTPLYTYEEEFLAKLRIIYDIATKFSASYVAVSIYNEARNLASRKWVAPNGVLLYEAHCMEMIAYIRGLNPDTTVVISSPQLGDPDYWDGPLLTWEPAWLLKLKNIVVDMHYYRPYDYTHPLAYRLKKSVKEIPALAFPPPLFLGTLLDNFSTKDWNNRRLHIYKFLAWCKKYGVTPWVGEFGIHKFTPNRMEWFTEVVKMFQEFGITYCVWRISDEFFVQITKQGEVVTEHAALLSWYINQK